MGPAYPYNKSARMFHKLCKIIYLLCGKNFWFEDMKYPPIFMKIYNPISKVFDVLVLVSQISAWGSFYTQHNLTEKQESERNIAAINGVLYYSTYLMVVYYKREIMVLVQTLKVALKEVYNDETTERMMIKTATRYVIVLYTFGSFLMLISTGIVNAIPALTSNATFNPVIAVWPDVEDRSRIAGIARVVHYILWWFFAARVSTSFVIVITITIDVGYQAKNLCKYFEGLNSIFEEEGTQRDKEKRYEDAFKTGITMHSRTLWCIKQLQLVGGMVFSAQTIITIGVLALAMLEWVNSDRTLMATMKAFFLAAGMLISSGILFWNAGDVTYEASQLPTAMFHSGWHNCQKESSVRVRKLVTIAMTQAQERVVLTGLWIMDLSYENYIAICRSTYSLFSVMY